MTMYEAPRRREGARAATPATDRIFVAGCVAIYLTLMGSVVGALHFTGF